MSNREKMMHSTNFQKSSIWVNEFYQWLWINTAAGGEKKKCSNSHLNSSSFNGRNLRERERFEAELAADSDRQAWGGTDSRSAMN